MTINVASLESVYTRPLRLGDDQPTSAQIPRAMGQASNYIIQQGRHLLSRWGGFDRVWEAAVIGDEQVHTVIYVSPTTETIAVHLLVAASDDDSTVRVMGNAATDQEIPAGVSDDPELHEIVLTYDVSAAQDSSIGFYVGADESDAIRGITVYDTPHAFLPDTADGFVNVTAIAKGKILKAACWQSVLNGQREVLSKHLKCLVNDAACGLPLLDGITAPAAAPLNAWDLSTAAWSSGAEGYWISPSAAWGTTGTATIKCWVRACMVSVGEAAELTFRTENETSAGLLINSTAQAWYSTGFTITTQADWTADHEQLLQLFCQGDGGDYDMDINAIVIEEEDSRPAQPRLKVLDFENTPPSIANLDPLLAINDTTVAPTYRYKLGDADAANLAAWGYGEDLSIAGAGAPTFNGGSPMMGADDDSCLFSVGQYYRHTSAAYANITTEDVVIELVVRWSTTNSRRLFGQYGAGHGMTAAESADRCSLITGDGAGVWTHSAALTDGQWYHILYFLDHDSNGQCYVNGNASGAPSNLAGCSGSWTHLACGLGVGAGSSTGTAATDAGLAYIALWKRDDWLDTHLQADLAQERFRRLAGAWPQVAKGTANPVAQSRSSAKYIYKWITATSQFDLFLVGDDVLSVRRLKDASGEIRTVYWPEPQVTNPVLQSSNLNNAAWTKSGAAAASALDQTGPGPGLLACRLTGLGAAGVDDCEQQLGNGTYANSADIAPGIWIKRVDTAGTLAIDNPSGTGLWLVDLSACPDAWIELTRASPYIGVSAEFAASAVGAGSVRFYKHAGASCDVDAWNSNLEDGYKQATSAIVTNGAPATRNADHLRLDGSDGNLDGSAGDGDQLRITCDVVLPNHDLPADAVAISISDGAAAGDSITLQVDAVGDVPAFDSAAAGGNAGAVTGTTDVVDGDRHTLRLALQTDSAKLLVDDAEEGSEDTSVDVCNDKDRIEIGERYDQTLPLGGGIANVCIYDRA